MQTTDLPTTQRCDAGMGVTRIGFGAWAVGGGGREFGWGPQEDDQSVDAASLELSARDVSLIEGT
jgi:aryl-alcohol dehydrogenase-like predicted oxidoreductase